MSQKTVFMNGRVLNFDTGELELKNILLDNGKVVGLGYLPDDDSDRDDIKEVDLTGLVIIPNIMDGFVSLSDPKFEARETLEELDKAATRAGITGIIGSPECAIDTPELIAHFYHKSRAQMNVPLYPIGSITKAQAGKELAEMGMMKHAGALTFADGHSLDSISTMKNALKYSSMLGVRLIVKPDETELSKGATMNDGDMATILGVKGASRVAEILRIKRDLTLLEHYGGQLHIFPVTCKESLDLIREAKARRLDVTCGTAPQYLYFTDQDLETYDSNLKVWPPLRTPDDQTALIEGIKDDTIDVIASKHTPLTVDEKRRDFTDAEFGMMGIELLISLVITKLHHEEGIALHTIFTKLSRNVINAFNIDRYGIAIGQAPNFTAIDINADRPITAASLISRCKNTPFIGHTLKGVVKLTVINGVITFD